MIEEYSNVGSFRATAEQEEIQNEDVLTGNQVRRISQKFFKQIPVSVEAFKASMHGVRERIGLNIGDRARLTQDQEALWRTWGDVFDGTYHNVPNGNSAANNSHTTLKGFTIDNLETGSLTPDNLWTQVVALANQLAQDGEAGSHVFSDWLGPFTLYRSAKEIMNSQLKANTAENNLNIFETDYGQVNIKASIFLGSTFSKASANADTSYHLISRNHQMERLVFYGLTTTMIEPQWTSNDSYAHRSSYHELTHPASPEGFVSTNGTV